MKNSMCPVLGVLSAIFGLSFQAPAQTPLYVTLNSTTNGLGANYQVQTNQVISIVGYDWTDKPSLFANLADGTRLSVTSNSFSGGGASAALTMPQILTGLTNINLLPASLLPTYNANVSGWATLQIMTPASATVVSNYVPADAVVIPSSATGNAQIILESSPDLVNWTAANPGTAHRPRRTGFSEFEPH